MKKLLMCMLVASLSASTMAQEKFETGKPGDDNYRYLDRTRHLKITSTIQNTPISNSEQAQPSTTILTTPRLKT